METILLMTIIVILMVVVALIFAFRNKENGVLPSFQEKLVNLQSAISTIEENLKEDFRTNRQENAGTAKENRTELNNTLLNFKVELSDALKNITAQSQENLKEINKTLAEQIASLVSKIEENNKTNRETLANNLKDFIMEQRTMFDGLKLEHKDLTIKTVDQLEKVTGKVEEKLNFLNEQAKSENIQMRESLITAFKGFQETFDNNIKSFNELQREKFGQLEIKQGELIKHTETKLETIRATVEEKLEKTLSERLGQSFETVGKQLIEVQKGLGEMQTLATDVGGLKKVLSNVKLRGGVGEVQLAMLLEQCGHEAAIPR